MFGAMSERAESALAAGRSVRALNLAWAATHRAVSREDREGVLAALRLAERVRDQSDGRTSARADQLVRYCRACLDSPEGRLSTPSAIGRLLEGQPGRSRRPPPEA